MTSQELFDFDRDFNTRIIGTDEAGRGPAAGGVFASAVCFEKITPGLIKDLGILNDSKKLSAKKRNFSIRRDLLPWLSAGTSIVLQQECLLYENKRT